MLQDSFFIILYLVRCYFLFSYFCPQKRQIERQLVVSGSHNDGARAAPLHLSPLPIGGRVNSSQDNQKMIETSIETLTQRVKKCFEDVDNALGVCFSPFVATLSVIMFRTRDSSRVCLTPPLATVQATTSSCGRTLMTCGAKNCCFRISSTTRRRS